VYTRAARAVSGSITVSPNQTSGTTSSIGFSGFSETPKVYAVKSNTPSCWAFVNESVNNITTTGAKIDTYNTSSCNVSSLTINWTAIGK
jgi:hypothetical protein